MPTLHAPDTQPLNRPVPAPTILLVEDDGDLRALMGELFRKVDFDLLEASNGHDALRIASEYSDTIDLVVADIGAVRLKPFLAQLRRVRLGVHLLLLSGLPRTLLLASGELDPSIPLLEKPFRISDLVRKVCALLGDEVG